MARQSCVTSSKSKCEGTHSCSKSLALRRNGFQLSGSVASPTTSRSDCRSRDVRRGAAAVEFACVAPVLAILLVGLVECSSLLDTQNQFSIAAREGARTALFERETMDLGGLTINQKVERDIRQYLNANGFDGPGLEVSISFPGDPNREFVLDDPDNFLDYFEVRVGYPVEDVLGFSPPGLETYTLSASVVFRNSPGTLVE